MFLQQEKLVLSTEQETLRVQGRAARAMAHQVTGPPLSVCSILRDQEIYNPIDNPSEQSNGTGGGGGDDEKADKQGGRQRYNRRQFQAWQEEVDDKFKKIKVSSILYYGFYSYTCLAGTHKRN